MRHAEKETVAVTAFSYSDSSDPTCPAASKTRKTPPPPMAMTTSANLQTVTDTTQGGTGTSVSYDYNKSVPYGSYLYGTLSKATDGDNNPTSYTYDSHGNLHIITPPAPLKPETISVDGASRVTSVIDGKGQQTSFRYDNLDRILQITYNNGRTIVYHYDNNGNVLSVKDETGITSFRYDNDNRILTKSLPGGEALTTSYDPVGNLASYTDSGGKVSYDYWPNNQIKDIYEPTVNNKTPTTSFTYNKGQRQTGTFPNAVVQSYSYDKANHITGIVATSSSNQTLITEQYSYQNSSSKAYSNLLQTQTYLVPNDPSNDTQSWSYSYDSMSRLTQADLDVNGQESNQFDYVYDKASNRTQSINAGANQTYNYTYNAAEELTSQSMGSQVTNYTYDGNGNLTAVTPGGPALAYNPKNQTTSIGSNSYAYSGPDQTDRVKINGTTLDYSGLGLSRQEDASGTTHFVRCSCGMLNNEQLPSGTRYYYLFDGLGSVVVLTSGKDGSVTNAYNDDPYGVTLNITQGVFNPWQYAAGYLDASGYYQFGTRYYDPSTGRWTQQDPVGGSLADLNSANRRTYASDDPVNVVDPSEELGFSVICYGNIPNRNLDQS